MRILLVRHAHAVESDGPLRDEQRYLSLKGRQTLRQVGRVLASEGITVDAILTSPLVRAVQTAELLGDLLGFTGVVEALPALQPGVPPRLAAGELPSRGVSVAIIGHEPGMSSLGAFLIGRPAFPPFRPAQVSCIEDGSPTWWLNPDVMRIDRLLVG